MEIEEMLAHVDYLMHIAGSKCDSWVDAQDLVQETILDGLHAIRKGKDINNARNWLYTVLNRKYYDLLREKYRKPLEFYGMDFDVAMEEENNQALLSVTISVSVAFIGIRRIITPADEKTHGFNRVDDSPQIF